MSEHHALVDWQRSTAEFRYETYNRDHRWDFGPAGVVAASSAPEFLGSENRVDPEQAFVASVASCHMLSFLAIAARRRLTVDSYRDEAVGHMEKNADGRLAITRVELAPQIIFTGDAPSDEELQKLHDRAHHECFIANSVKTDISLRRLC